MPPAPRDSVASAASVLDDFQASELAAIAVSLPPGWVCTIRARDGQVAIHPSCPLDEWSFEVLVDPETRMIYAGLGWQARHGRDVTVRATQEWRNGATRGGTRRSSI